MEHLDEVKYAAGKYVVATANDLISWRFGAGTEGHGEASGPCPTCRGDAYGPPLPDIGGREPVKEFRGATVEVSCACHCGHDHGKGEELGCGRWWIASGRVSRG